VLLEFHLAGGASEVRGQDAAKHTADLEEGFALPWPSRFVLPLANPTPRGAVEGPAALDRARYARDDFSPGYSPAGAAGTLTSLRRNVWTYCPWRGHVFVVASSAGRHGGLLIVSVLRIMNLHSQYCISKGYARAANSR
jgi:hypothetical protein